MSQSDTVQCLLSTCAQGWRGVIHSLQPISGASIPWAEMERRLLEIGFIEGMRVELLHEGPIKRDPIAVRVGEMTVALRRSDAAAILVQTA